MFSKSNQNLKRPLSSPIEELEMIFRILMRKTLPRLGAWALRVIEALPKGQKDCFGWRDYSTSEGWAWPHSNAAERIEVYLWLAKCLNDSRYFQAAEHCANALINDPWHGIYQGDEEDGRGMVWYWRDIGLYMTNYTMRVPSAMLEMAMVTGNRQYIDAAKLTGQQLLRSQQPCGILRAGWYPKNPPKCLPKITSEISANWLPEDNINIRFAYVANAYAEMFTYTRDIRYKHALESLTDALAQLQHRDGSFPQDVKFNSIGVNNAGVKGHFLYYMINGMASAVAIMPEQTKLRDITIRLADFIVSEVEHGWTAFYGDCSDINQQERQFWHLASADPAYGLAWLSHTTGNLHYRLAALQLVIGGMMRCLDWPDVPDMHGGMASKSLDLSCRGLIGSHFHFWLLMGLKALEETGIEYQQQAGLKDKSRIIKNKKDITLCLDQGAMYNIFSLGDLTFPQNFLWGSATAGHQVDGNNIHSQYWRMEQSKPLAARSGRACNHWELYRDDIDMLAGLGHRAYRFSIEWSRIEPTQGEFNREAMNHYIEMLLRLKERNISTFVTLHHFTHPAWFEGLGGFYKRENVKFFQRYVDHVVPAIAEFVDGWNVINEFNLCNTEDSLNFKANMIHAHVAGYQSIKACSNKPVSSAHAFVKFFPYRRNDRFDNIMTDWIDWISHEFFFHAMRTGEIVLPYREVEYVKEAKGAIDFWAVNYYTRRMVDARAAKGWGQRFRHKQVKMIDMDFYLEEIYPEGLIANLERLTDKPVYITENGCSCDDDRFRIIYIALNLCALHEAIERGLDLRGYFYWSLMDNFEWGSFLPRFGLVDVDFKTLKRTPKQSAYFYREIVENNGITQAMLRKYLPELPQFRSY